MSLQQELEATYQKFYQSLDEATPTNALSMLDHTGLPAGAADAFKSLWQSPEKKAWMKTELYPKFDPNAFLGIRNDGDWVGYYYSTTTTISMNGEDTIKPSIGVLRFHKVDGAWKLYQQMSSAAAYEEDDWSNPKDKLDMILAKRTNIKVVPESYV